MNQTNTKPEKTAYLVLLIVVGFGVVLRLVYFVGIECQDDSGYINTAIDLFNREGFYVGGNVLENRWTMQYPLYFFALIFGPSEFSLAFWPLLCSILEIAAVGLLGFRLGSVASGLVGAFILAAFPPHVFIGTRTMPDAPLAAFITLMFLVFVIGHQKLDEKRRLHASYWFIAGGFFLAIGYLAKTAALIVGLPLALCTFHVLLNRRRIPWLSILLPLALVGVILFENYIHTVNGQQPWHRFKVIAVVYTQLTHHTSSLSFYPDYVMASDDFGYPIGRTLVFLIVGVLASLRLLFSRSYWTFIALWLWAMALYLQFGVQNFETFERINKEERYLSLVYAPLALCTGYGLSWLSQLLRNKAAESIGLVLVLLLYAAICFPLLAKSHTNWTKGASCKSAARSVLEAFKKEPEELLVIPAGPTQTILNYLITAEMIPNKRGLQLEFRNGRTDPLPEIIRLGEPFLIVLNLDITYFKDGDFPDDQLPDWLQTPEKHWELVQDLGKQDCMDDLRPQIYRVRPVP